MKLIVTHAGVTSEYNPPQDLGVIVIGRGESCDISLPNEKAASRKHATLERTVDGWKLVDQMSSNGTALNGEKVNFAFLKEGDVISFGRTSISVQGIAPAVAAPRLKAPATQPRADVARPMAYVPPRKSPVGAVIAVVLVLAVVAGGGYFVFSQLGSGHVVQEVADVPSPRKAELSLEDKSALAQAKAVMGGNEPALTRVRKLEQIEQKLKSSRGSVALGEVDGMLKRLWREVDADVTQRVESALTAAEEWMAQGQYRAAHDEIQKLQAWIESDEYLASFGRANRLRINRTIDAAHEQSEAWFNYTLAELDRLADQLRFDEALALADEIPLRALLDDSDRSLFEHKRQQLKQMKEAAQAPEIVEPELPEVPSVLDRVKKDETKLPGRNPLFPDGPASERELKQALDARLLQATIDRKLTDYSFDWRGDRARIVRANSERIYFDVITKDKRTGAEIGFGTSKKWSDLKPGEWLQLYDRLPEPTTNELLATAVFAFDAGFVDEGSRRALQVLKASPDWKEGIDILISTKRRIELPEGGFVEFDNRLVTPAEREDALFTRHLGVVLDRFEKGLGSKDKRKRDDSEAAFNELLEMGERAVPGAIRILDEVLKKEINKAEVAAGLAGADGGKMDMLLDELDKRRKHALELIFDTVRYPYPYAPNQAEVQADVDARVAAVREIWDDPTGFLGQANPEYEAVIDRVRAISERMDQLDPANQYHQSTSDETLEFLRGQANKKLTIRTWPGSNKRYESLINFNRRVMEYNEAFPVGPSHTDNDGRQQVRITNEYRIMFSRHALKLNDKLFWAAWHHSKYCVEHNGGQIAHVIKGEPRGEGPADRMAYEGYTGGGGENIHMNSQGPTPLSSHNSWCQSSGHHRNILNPHWRVLGSGKFRTIWTQNFGSVDEGDGNSVSKGGE